MSASTTTGACSATAFFPKILRNTFQYVALTLLFFNVGLALLLALLTAHVSRRVGFLFRLLWLLPRITPSVVYIVMWQRIAQQPPYGILNQFLGWLGVENQPYWIPEAPWVFVVLVNGFVGASFGMIIFTSAIEAIPADLIIAAKVDGAGSLALIRDITLPLLRWPLLFVVTYQTLSLLVSFEYILLLTNGGPGLFTTEVWALTAYKRALQTYFGSNQWAYGAAWGFVLVLIGATSCLLSVCASSASTISSRSRKSMYCKSSNAPSTICDERSFRTERIYNEIPRAGICIVESGR